MEAVESFESQASIRGERSALRRGERPVLAVAALASTAGLALQLWASLTYSDAGVGHALVRYLSYFTILSNLAVALTSIGALVGGGFFGGPRVRAAIALYIVVTGTVWLVLLAPHYHPQGLSWWSNALLHYVAPLAYPAFWLIYSPHGRLLWRDAAWFLAFPAGYLGWTLARGSWSQEYPYGFVDVSQLGMPAVLLNSLGLFAVFLGLGLGLVAIDRRLGRRLGRR